MNILVIEDSRFLRGLVAKTLTKAGHAVTEAANGEEGVRAARTGRPSLILLDMMLPRLDGIRVLRMLKQDALTARIPVIVLTGLSQRNEAKLREAGAAAYIEKASLGLDQGADRLIPVVETTMAALSQSRGGREERSYQPEANREAVQAEPSRKERLP